MSDTVPVWEKVHALLNPKNIVIMGASDKPGNWAQRVWRNLNRYGYPNPIYPVNPTRDQVWDTRCYRALADLPEPPDHLLMLIPASAVPDALLEAKRLGARSATIMSAGFGEATDEAGQKRGQRLKEVIAQTGLAVSGPNCLGNMNAAASMMTGPDDRLQKIVRGPVAVVGQSGGVAMAFKRTLEERGIDTGAVVTSGNESGLSTADYIDYFARMEGVKVIVSYLEAVNDPPGFLAACRRAREAGRPVVVVKLGASNEGRAAAMAHTGALAGSMEAFDAVAGEAGVIRLRNIDDAIEAIEYLVRAKPPKSGRLAALTYSGAMRGLLLDAASAHGLSFVGLSQSTRDTLQTVLTVGSGVGNPLDAGFAALTSEDAFTHCVKTLLADENVDALILQEEIPRAKTTERKENNYRFISALAEKSAKPIIYISMASYGLNEYSLGLRDQFAPVPFLQEIDKSMRVLRAIVDYGARGKTQAPKRAGNAAAKRVLDEILSRASGPALNEIDSKRLIAAYGIASPREALAKTAEEAAAHAKDIGFPVVAKLVSNTLTHKSDVGGVVLNLQNADSVRQAFQSIETKMKAHKEKPDFGGVLIAEQVVGGRECVLGANLDAEVGPVVLFGTGGVEIELHKDVAVGAPVNDEKDAEALISRTRAGTVLAGYRGAPALDKRAAAKALVGLSQLMLDADGRIASIDINPFLVREKGGTALDALVVLKR